MGILPPLPFQGEGWGEGGLVREMCQSDRLHSYLPLTRSLSLKREREVLFLLPTAKPEEPKKLPISAVVP